MRLETSRIPRLGLVSPIMGYSNIPPFNRLIRVLASISQELFVIQIVNQEPNEADETEIEESGARFVHRRRKGLIPSILSFLATQLRICRELAKRSDHSRVWVFYLGEAQVLPILVAKTCGNSVVLVIGGSLERELESQRGHYRNITKIQKLFKAVSISLSDRIVLSSQSLIAAWELLQHEPKIVIAHEHFIDFDAFRTHGEYESRPEVIGFVGNLTKVKGAMNFVEAVPLVIARRPNLRFLMVGDGDLLQEVNDFVVKRGLQSKVDMTGRIPHNDIPAALDRIRLLVVPSYSEGLPNIILEAMACGTPVLANPVGGIQTIIQNGRTGYLMKDNSPGCVAQCVLAALEDSNLSAVVKNAGEYVRTEYSYEAAVGQWKSVLSLGEDDDTSRAPGN